MANVSVFERWWLNAWPHRVHIRKLVPSFLKSCPEPFRGEVLEIGAGKGWTSRQVLETFPQVELTATDTDPAALSKLKRLQEHYGARLKVAKAAAEQLPFDRSSFDMVIAVHVLHHLSDVRAVVRQMLRVVRPGGLIGIAEENQHYVTWPLSLLWSAASRFNREEAAAALKAEECEILYEKGDVHFVIWARKRHPVEASREGGGGML